MTIVQRKLFAMRCPRHDRPKFGGAMDIRVPGDATVREPLDKLDIPGKEPR